MRLASIAVSVFLSISGTFSFAQSPRVLVTSPTQNELNVPTSANISVTFDVDVDETTINDSTFVVNARSTGLHQGTIAYDNPTKTAVIHPVDDFDVGEMVTVVLTTDIQSSQGIPLDSSYVWCFTIEVNDGAGSFAPHSVYAVGSWPRSVFAGDLDGDGDLDLATANDGDNNVSVLMNAGDGTFPSHSVYAVGGEPRSVFAADLDGDGDLDLATANDGDNVSVLLNMDSYACGDCNADGFVNFADALYVKNYYYQTPPGSPAPIGQGDVNLDGFVNFADALYLKNYYYQTPPGSPPPCEPLLTAPFRERGMKRWD